MQNKGPEGRYSSSVKQVSILNTCCSAFFFFSDDFRTFQKTQYIRKHTVFLILYQSATAAESILGKSLLAFGLLPLTFFCPPSGVALIPHVPSTVTGTSWRGKRLSLSPTHLRTPLVYVCSCRGRDGSPFGFKRGGHNHPPPHPHPNQQHPRQAFSLLI